MRWRHTIARWLGAVALAWVCALSTPALAGEGPPPEALERNDDAQQAFDSGDFESAIRDWSRVLDLYPNHVTIWNIARSYEELEDWREARSWFERFASTDGLGADEVARANERIAAAEAQLALDPPPDPVTPVDPVVETPTPTPNPTEPVDSDPVDLTVWAWTATGVGAVGAIAAGVTWALVSTTADEANGLPRGAFDQYEALSEEIEGYEAGFYVSLAVALAGTAAAVTLFAIEGTRVEGGAAGTTTRLQVAPGGVDLTVRF